MYHIAKDKRVQKSAALICEGMLICLKEKDISQISVSDLWKASGVSRATFYRLFDNISDVLTYQCEQIIASIIENILASPPQERTYKQMATTILSAAMEHCQLLSAVSNSNRLDIINNALCKQIPTLNEIYMIDNTHAAGINEYFLHCVCSLISTTIDLWIKHGQKQTPEELYSAFALITRLLEKAFNGTALDDAVASKQ